MAQGGGRTQPGDAQVRRYLGGVAASLIFSHAQLLFLAPTEPGGGEGEQEERQQRRECGAKRTAIAPEGESGASVRTAVITPPVSAASGVAARASQTRSARPRLIASPVCVALLQRDCSVANAHHGTTAASTSHDCQRSLLSLRGSAATRCSLTRTVHFGPAYRWIRGPIYNHLSTRK